MQLNHVCADAKAAKRHRQRCHNAPNNKLNTPRNESTSMDVEAKFTNDVCFNNLLDDMNSLTFVNIINTVPESDRNFIQHTRRNSWPIFSFLVSGQKNTSARRT